MKLSDKLSAQLQGLGLEELAKKARELEELASLAVCDNQGWDEDGEELTCKDLEEDLFLSGGECSVCYLKGKLLEGDDYE